MAIVVVGGSGRGVGKTALVCGLIRALPGFRWTAVKITGHAHGKAERIWEEMEPGQGSDTARYLAAGAARALLLTVGEKEMGPAVAALRTARRGETQDPNFGVGLKANSDENFILESNRVLEHLTPDLCLAIQPERQSEAKPSFAGVLERADAIVAHAQQDETAVGVRPVFRLKALDLLSPKMLEWLRSRLGDRGGG